MSSKKAEVPNGFDFSETRDALEAIIVKLPNPQACQISTRLQAKEIIALWRQPTLVPNNRFAKKAESKKLDEIEQLAKRLRTAWHELDPELQVQIRRRLTSGRFIGERGWTTDSQRVMFGFLEFGPDVLKEPLDAARDAIDKGKQAGRTKWPSIRIVEACAFIWKDRIGQSLPSQSDVQFASFVHEVFDVLRIEASDHTLRAWRQQKSG